MNKKLISVIIFMLASSFSFSFASEYKLYNFIFPAIDKPFINRAIESYKTDSAKDFADLFGAQPLAAQTACGYTIQEILKPSARMNEEIKNFNNASKLAQRNMGVEMDLEGTFEVNPVIIGANCPEKGKAGDITVRYNSSVKTVMGKFITNTDTVNIMTVYYSEINKPELVRVLAYITSSGSMPGPKPFMTVTYSSPVSDESAQFISVPSVMSMSTLVYSQYMPAGKTRITTYNNGNLFNVMNMKKGLYHGIFKTEEMRQKVMGQEFVMPGSFKCYKNGSEIKTTGEECNVD